MNKIPNPGSDKAQKLGCTCPVLDNSHGEGLGDGKFWITQGCPLHTWPKMIGEHKDCNYLTKPGTVCVISVVNMFQLRIK